MTQLILDGIVLPESIKDTYKAWREILSTEVQMISGRVVRENRGFVWCIEYQHGYFDDETRNALIAACEKGRTRPITCGFMTQEGGNILTYSDFFVKKFERPKFFWSTEVAQGDIFVPKPMWADFSVNLREVRPHD